MLSIRSVVVVVVAGAIVGCSATPSQTAINPSGDARFAQGTPAQQRARGILPAFPIVPVPATMTRGRSWMSPDAKKASLLYVADEAAGVVDVFSYPQGKPQGTLSGFNAPSAVCSNKAGDVYIANGGATSVDVYAHGGTSPLRVLKLPGYPELSCSVDPTSGDFAIGVVLSVDESEIAVFKGGKGMLKTYMPGNQGGLPGCAYDPKGNLYCDAYPFSEDEYLLFELPKNKSALTRISVTGAYGLEAGPMQWDGQALAFGSGATSTIYQIGLTKAGGSITGSTVLNGAGNVSQFWIDGKRLIAPTYGGTDGPVVGYFKYPVGGSATKTITGFSEPDGVAVSTVGNQ
jgi:hypothetical protein